MSLYNLSLESWVRRGMWWNLCIGCSTYQESMLDRSSSYWVPPWSPVCHIHGKNKRKLDVKTPKMFSLSLSLKKINVKIPKRRCFVLFLWGKIEDPPSGVFYMLWGKRKPHEVLGRVPIVILNDWIVFPLAFSSVKNGVFSTSNGPVSYKGPRAYLFA